jgi:hypothetical protein
VGRGEADDDDERADDGTSSRNETSVIPSVLNGNKRAFDGDHEVPECYVNSLGLEE